jgi:DNA-directed RNA polymerase subunit L
MTQDNLSPENLTIEEMHLKNGKLDINFKHPLFAIICSELVKTFDDYGGTNYVEFTMEHETRGKFSVLIQKKDGLTPAEKNTELKKEIDRLKRILESAGAV